MSTFRLVASLLACALPLAACTEKQDAPSTDSIDGQAQNAAQAAAQPAVPAAAPVAAPAAGAIPPSGIPATKTNPEFYLPAESELTTTASGLKYIVLREGSGTSPTLRSQFSAHYCGWYTSGEVFDSTYARNEPLSYPVSLMIPGWQEALVMMKPGSEYILVVSPELGYGVGGGNGIPPNSTLVFRMELLSTSG